MALESILRRAPALLIILLVGLALSGCGSTIDGPAVEKDIKSSVPGLVKLGNNLPVKSVTCPDDRDAAKGKKFDCKFTMEDGLVGVATVTIQNSDGDIEYVVTRYASGQIADDIEKTFADNQNIKLTVDCPETIDDGAVCDFQDEDGRTGKMTVTFPKKGQVEYDPRYNKEIGPGQSAASARNRQSLGTEVKQLESSQEEVRNVRK